MSGVEITWGGTERPKVGRRAPDGIAELVEALKGSPGVWAQVSIEGVSLGALHSALKVAGCDVVTRNGGSEIHACWPMDPSEPTGKVE